MSEPRHAPPAGRARRRQELLYDPSIPTPSHAERALTLVSQAADATLSTLRPEGHPYGSLVLFALHNGDPILLISALAEHTKNLRHDPRCSLLVKEAGPANPLALGRVSLVATALELGEDDREDAKTAFLTKNPDAAFYADFGDFSFWRLQVSSIRYIGGFGRMSWLEMDAWHDATPDPICDAAARIIDHMNDDHRDAMKLYCQAFSRAGAVQDATMTGVDRYGFEMRAETAEGPRPIRVAFDAPAHDATAVRMQMVALVKRARAQLSDA